jgi:hypothetical protein
LIANAANPRETIAFQPASNFSNTRSAGASQCTGYRLPPQLEIKQLCWARLLAASFRPLTGAAPGGGDGAHQRLEMEARLLAQHFRDAMAAQSFLDYRPNGGNADASESFAEFRCGKWAISWA